MHDERYEAQEGQQLPGLLMIALIGPIILMLVVILLLRSRRKSRTDRALDRINRVINESEIPDRAKHVLMDTVEDVRSAMTTLRERAGELSR